VTASTPDGVPVVFEDPFYRAAVVDLLGAIAYGEISAFERLAEDGKLAPTLEDKVEIAGMACVQFGRVGCTTGSGSWVRTLSPRWRRSAGHWTSSTRTPRRPTGTRA
jgi:hypothetical protein